MSHLVFEPIEFMEKLAAITPRPALNLAVYHGVLAPHARWRSPVVSFDRPAPPPGARTLRELARVSFSEITDYAAWGADGQVTLVPSAILPPDAAAAVREVRRTPEGELLVKLHDKVAALGLLAKVRGLLRDRVEHTGPGGGPIEVVALTPAERARRVNAVLRSGGALPARAGPPPSTSNGDSGPGGGTP
jgi:hypothetical protein